MAGVAVVALWKARMEGLASHRRTGLVVLNPEE
jgi:hypothetical protein